LENAAEHRQENDLGEQRKAKGAMLRSGTKKRGIGVKKRF
jgi:hypothetical protein